MNILGRPAKHVLAVRCDHENTASRYELAQSKYSRYSMLRRKLNKALPLGEKVIWNHKHAVRLTSRNFRKHPLECYLPLAEPNVATRA